MNIVKSIRAIARSVRISPTKIRPITFSIVGKPAMTAVSILSFEPRKGARILLKTLKSAIANAENNNNLSSANLIVSEAHVDDATPLKRMMPAARGSGHPIKKRNSHVRIVLTEVTGADAGKKLSKKVARAQKKDKKETTAKKEGEAKE
jgi:large subunit ribosomal protein L22